MNKKTRKETHGTQTVSSQTFKILIRRFDTLNNNLKSFATKDDLREMGSQLALAIQRNYHEIASIKDTMATKADINRLNNRFDDYAGKFTHMDRRYVIGTGRVNEIDDVLKNHEGRLSLLESK